MFVSGDLVNRSDAFFPCKVFKTNDILTKTSKKTFELNEKEKSLYNERIRENENGSLTPLVISSTGKMGREYRMFLLALS